MSDRHMKPFSPGAYKPLNPDEEWDVDRTFAYGTKQRILADYLNELIDLRFRELHERIDRLEKL